MMSNRRYVTRNLLAPPEDTRNPHGRIDHGATPSVVVPIELLEDRARRLLAQRSLTAEICGDPPPGQSALDKKRAKDLAPV